MDRRLGRGVMRKVGSTLAVLAAVVVTLGLGACSSSNGNNGSGASARSAPVAPSTSDGALSSPAGVPQPASKFTMPNEVGANLQGAQDDIQRVSGNPLFITRSKDATGAGRHQVLDRNWKVCSQNVPTGTSVDQSVGITFGAVKLAESCP